MKILTLSLILLCLMVGCGERHIYEPPFVIVQKLYVKDMGDNYWSYGYVDKTGHIGHFNELTDKYNIGDTIGAKPDLHRDWMRELSEKQNKEVGK